MSSYNGVLNLDRTSEKVIQSTAKTVPPIARKAQLSASRTCLACSSKGSKIQPKRQNSITLQVFLLRALFESSLSLCFALGLGGWADPIPRSVERPHPVILKGWAWLYSRRTRGEATKRRVPGVSAKTCFNFRPRQPCAGRCGAPLVRYQERKYLFPRFPN